MQREGGISTQACSLLKIFRCVRCSQVVMCFLVRNSDVCASSPHSAPFSSIRLLFFCFCFALNLFSHARALSPPHPYIMVNTVSAVFFFFSTSFFDSTGKCLAHPYIMQQSNKATELGAVLRRSSKPAVDRIQVLFYALLERASSHVSCGDTKEDCDWTSLSLVSLLTVLRFCFPGIPPRFLFVLGVNGHLLRSADRGTSWKCVLPQVPITSRETSHTTSSASQMPTLESITGLLPADSTDGDDEKDTADDVLPTGYVRCTAVSNDVVVCGGDDGLLCVSVNRGVTFQVFPRFFSVAMPPSVGEERAIDRIQIIPESPSMTSRFVVCATAGKCVLTASMFISGLEEVTKTDPRVVFTCTTTIAHLQCHGHSSPSMRGSIIVSERGCLHISWDNGATFWRVPHQLGYIRDVACVECARHTETSGFPAGSRIAQLLAPAAKTVEAKAMASNQARKGGSFEYSSALEQPVPTDASRATLRSACTRNLRRAPIEDVFFTHMFVVGEGTDVLPYDFSSLLCVGLAIRDGAITTFSVAETVSFIPYVRSSLKEPVRCLVQHCLCGTGGLAFTRCNSSGTSFSRDAVTWSDPKKSAAVAVVPTDGDGLLVVGQRGTITQFGPNATTSHVVPTALRVPTLRTAASL